MNPNIGASKTIIQRQSPVAHVSNSLNAFHPFLKLRQPISQSAYPEPREFKSQQQYIFPFTFVVPEHLLPHACNHYSSNPHLKAAHTQLPPSLGDAMVSSDGKSLMNDMAPMMSEISYKIRVSVQRRNPPANTRPFYTVCSVAKKVRIVPATIEQPPLEIECNSTDGYRTSREKNIRKALLGGKTGRLLVSAAQPKPLQLPTPDNASNIPVSSHLKLRLRFEPRNEDEQPPRLRTTSSKLKVLTYYAAQPWTAFPSKDIIQSFNTTNHGLYSHTVTLSSLCVASAQWTKHDGSTDADELRRSSLTSSSSTSSNSVTHPSVSCSSSFISKTYYTASITVPISLPKNKTFVPTFHSCLVSRVYTLDLSLSYQSPNTLLPSPSVSLNFPIQITSAPGNGIAPSEEIPSYMSLPETQIEEEYYRPRSVAPPSEDDYPDQYSPRSERSSASYAIEEDGNDDENAPPEYSAIAQSSVRTSGTISSVSMLGSLR